jgi:hypothetical protein
MRRVYCTPVLFVGVLLLVSGNARGQAIAVADHWYFDPLIAESRAPQIAFTFPAWIPELQYAANDAFFTSARQARGLPSPSLYDKSKLLQMACVSPGAFAAAVLYAAGAYVCALSLGAIA